jgi:uncharacterized phage protein (TIGR01671 family)
MREIKFRYFDTKRQEFITDCDVYFIDSNCILAGDLDNPPVVDITKNVVVSQYTGLKDSNEIEIFEGDIVKVPSINDHVHGNYSYKEVIYRNGTWIAQYVKSEKGQVVPRGYMAGHLIDCYDHDYKALVFYDDRLEHTDIEIVGNIYENQELLKGADEE